MVVAVVIAMKSNDDDLDCIVRQWHHINIDTEMIMFLLLLLLMMILTMVDLIFEYDSDDCDYDLDDLNVCTIALDAILRMVSSVIICALCGRSWSRFVNFI
jgi:hypothetical protein